MKLKKLFLILSLCTTLLFSLGICDAESRELDLEKSFQQDFVLGTKQLSIPGYPEAFNPSFVQWRGATLLSFRVIPDPKQKFISYIGVVWLDEEFEILGSPQILPLRDSTCLVPSYMDDARLFVVGDELYLIYSDHQGGPITAGGFRMQIAKLHYEQGEFSIVSQERLMHFEGQNEKRREKNWVPFHFLGHIYLAYSLMPHKIFYPIGNSSCQTVASSLADIHWPWGELRGSTAALLEGSEYLSFFHSSVPLETLHSENKKILHYFMGAYTFECYPPFAITRVSPEPIVAPGFYSGTHYKNIWKPQLPIFPAGLIIDPNFIWVAYGREDRECWILKLEKKGLLKSLKPVRTKHYTLH